MNMGMCVSMFSESECSLLQIIWVMQHSQWPQDMSQGGHQKDAILVSFISLVTLGKLCNVPRPLCMSDELGKIVPSSQGFHAEQREPSKLLSPTPAHQPLKHRSYSYLLQSDIILSENFFTKSFWKEKNHPDKSSMSHIVPSPVSCSPEFSHLNP